MIAPMPEAAPTFSIILGESRLTAPSGIERQLDCLNSLHNFKEARFVEAGSDCLAKLLFK
jgi:hypothetical protein